MTNKNAFVCFCVDGRSDKKAMENQFNEMFDDVDENIKVGFRYALINEGKSQEGGDLTTESGVTSDNITEKLYKYYFKNWDINSDLGWHELTTIIHIVDLDGAFIDDDNVRPYTEEEKEYADKLSDTKHCGLKNTLYYEDHIAVRSDYDKEKELKKKYKEKVRRADPPEVIMRERNERKRKNLGKLFELAKNGSIQIKEDEKTIRYMLYYFSSNIDHFLSGDANIAGNMKLKNATDFYEKYDDAEKFKKFVLNSGCIAKSNYEQSWFEVFKGNNSLKRGTNINLLIEKIENSKIEDWM